MKERSKLDVRKYSFSQKTINERNKLSTDCVLAGCVNTFKSRIDNYAHKGGLHLEYYVDSPDKPMVSLSILF